jgi:hypothetical protein
MMITTGRERKQDADDSRHRESSRDQDPALYRFVAYCATSRNAAAQKAQ